MSTTKELVQDITEARRDLMTVSPETNEDSQKIRRCENLMLQTEWRLRNLQESIAELEGRAGSPWSNEEVEVETTLASITALLDGTDPFDGSLEIGLALGDGHYGDAAKHLYGMLMWALDAYQEEVKTCDEREADLSHERQYHAITMHKYQESKNRAKRAEQQLVLANVKAAELALRVSELEIQAAMAARTERRRDLEDAQRAKEAVVKATTSNTADL